MIRIGNCGWSYLNVKKYFENWEETFESKLQAYAKLFDLVEINSTFYRIPKLTTVEKWREQVDKINPKFEFTIKCSQIITHKDRFNSDLSIRTFDTMKEIANILRAKILLFQSPGSFKPAEENFERVKKFFKKIDRENFVLVWEVRWKKDWTPEIVKKLFSDLEINQCVDPFRQDCYYSKDLIYYRLHGFGKPSMYNYQYSDQELKALARRIKKEKMPVYILFNNSTCYEDGLRFRNFLKGMK
jgi:uncharacterized protein YecE (DUF72 family)